ncbi:MAG: polysaccharide biosynthesis/export family protein [Verrucomicrobiota bacterium]
MSLGSTFIRLLVLLVLASVTLFAAEKEVTLQVGKPPAEEPAKPTDVPKPTEVTTKSSYCLRSRDFIRVGVINEADTLIERRINPDGTIDIPFLKTLIPIAGLTITEAQAEITKRFRRYFKEPQVVITIVNYAERRVYVSGYVGKPGPVNIPPEENLTLGKALSMAGGILARGRRSDVAIKRMRDGKLVTIVKDVRKIDSGDEPDFVLEDDDAIYVDDSKF